MSNCKYLIACFLVMVCVTSGWSQVARSPFSSFALGDYYGTAAAHSQGMGGVGVSNPQIWYLNTQNPALLVFNNFTTFQSGIQGERRSVTDGISTETNGNGNLNYLNFGVPFVRSKWSTALSVMPYTGVNHKYTYELPIENTSAKEIDTNEGTGGITRLSWSHGVALHKYLSVGGRVNYLFGSIENKYSNVVALPNQLVVVTPFIYERYYYKDFSFTGAISLHVDSISSKNYRLNVGAVYDMKADIRTQLLQTLSRDVDTADTITTAFTGNTTIPGELSAGISFGRPEHWNIGVDAKTLDYSQFKDFRGLAIEDARKGWKVAVGGEFAPDPNSLGSYLKRVVYRTGVSLEEYPYLVPSVNGKTIRDFGINFGLSMPISRYHSVDMALRWGKRGNIGNNSIEENYIKIYFGVTFNDQWFIKRRFD